MIIKENKLSYFEKATATTMLRMFKKQSEFWSRLSLLFTNEHLKSMCIIHSKANKNLIDYITGYLKNCEE
jgi:hypothetical protein